METLDNLKQLWPRVRAILLPCEGAASQAYTLSLPRSEMERIIDQFCRRTGTARITVLNGYALGSDRVLDCDVVTRTDILTASDYSIIVGEFYRDRSVQLWIWPDEANGEFDAEFVFFADEFFVDGQDDDAHRDSFELIYSLAEIARENNPNCECVLSAHEGGDPRDMRDDPMVVFW